MVPDAVSVSNASIEYVVSSSEEGDKIWITLLNQENESQSGDLKIDFVAMGIAGEIESVELLNPAGKIMAKLNGHQAFKVDLHEYGLAVLKITGGKK